MWLRTTWCGSHRDQGPSPSTRIPLTLVDNSFRYVRSVVIDIAAVYDMGGRGEQKQNSRIYGSIEKVFIVLSVDQRLVQVVRSTATVGDSDRSTRFSRQLGEVSKFRSFDFA